MARACASGRPADALDQATLSGTAVQPNTRYELSGFELAHTCSAPPLRLLVLVVPNLKLASVGYARRRAMMQERVQRIPRLHFETFPARLISSA